MPNSTGDILWYEHGIWKYLRFGSEVLAKKPEPGEKFRGTCSVCQGEILCNLAINSNVIRHFNQESHAEARDEFRASRLNQTVEKQLKTQEEHRRKLPRLTRKVENRQSSARTAGKMLV